jgi:dienelactone hydrolase
MLATTGKDTPHVDVGLLLYAKGWNVVSVDVPCHGVDHRPGEPADLRGWPARIAQGEDIVPPFQTRVNDVLSHLVNAKLADPARIAAAGVSRGGYMAFQAAAGNPDIRAVAALAPVTDLLALLEFAKQQDNALARQLALVNVADSLAGRPAWIIIGSADTRVGADKAIAFSRALVNAAIRRALPPRVTLSVLPTPGHQSFPDWHTQAADWLQANIDGTR